MQGEMDELVGSWLLGQALEGELEIEWEVELEFGEGICWDLKKYMGEVIG